MISNRGRAVGFLFRSYRFLKTTSPHVACLFKDFVSGISGWKVGDWKWRWACR